MGYANGDCEVICLGCGLRDSAETAIRIVGEFAEHEAATLFERRISENCRGNRFARFRSRRPPAANFRWRLVGP